MALLSTASTLTLALAAGPWTAPAPDQPAPAQEPAAREPAALGEAPAEQAVAPTEGYAGRAVGPIAGVEGILAGEGSIVTFEQLDEVILWRDGRSPNGQAALRQLLELRVLASLARKENISITDDALRARFDELDAEARQGGVQGGLAEYVAAQGIDLVEFREYLRLSMIHEELTRRALGLGPDQPVSADQQQLWLEDTLRTRGYEEKPHPWVDGIVCTSGDLAITRAEYGAHLRNQVSEEDRREAVYLVLLERAVRARMPEVSNEGVSAALDREVERRSAEAESDPRYQGATYEQLLDARGLSLEALRRDPAVRAAALAHEAVDRANDDDGLRAVYDEEREFFDGLFGESVEVRLCFRNASAREDDPLRPSFAKVEKELSEMLSAIEGPADFARVVDIHSEDRATRENGGFVGRITRGAPGVPKQLRDAVFAALDAASGDPDKATIEGKIIGPIRLQNGVVIALLSSRLPPPTWDDMKINVHRELRRRFLEETLPRASVLTYLDPK